jgi:hypothetical protein
VRLFRALNTPSVACWDADGDPDWVAAEDGPADLVTHFVPSENRLSVYLVEDEMVERLCAAFCAARKNVKPLDFVLIAPESLRDAGFSIDGSAPGDIPDAEARGWHRDIANLTLTNLSNLALLFRAQAERRRILQRTVVQYIDRGISNGWIARDALNPNLVREMQSPAFRG